MPSEGSLHPFEMQSTQQGCVWGWLGRRRFLKADDSSAGSSGTGGAVAGNQHYPSWLKQVLPQGLFVPFQVPLLSSGMNIV